MAPFSFRVFALVLSSLIVHGFVVHAQQFDYTIPWTSDQPISREGIVYQVPTIANIIPATGIPQFSRVENLKSVNYTSAIQITSWEPVNASIESYFESIGHHPSNQPDISAIVTREDKNPRLSIVCNPYFFKDGLLHKVLSFQVNLMHLPPKPITKDFAATSVLDQGNWYKIAIATDGIYKIDKSLLNALGISTQGLNPNHIHVFGNGEGSLPELNATPYTDDLAQNSVQVVGGADGIFDDGDYVLFYGFGPHKWYANGSTEFEQRRNPYSDKSYYFLLISKDLATPQPILEVDWSTGLEQSQFTSYDYREVYENDLISLVGGGKRWYGELFDIELTRTFNFAIPSVDVTSPMKFRVSMASNALTGSGTAQKFSVGGAQLFQTTLPVAPYDYNRSVVNFSWNNPNSNIPLQIDVVRNSPSTLTYLDRILLNGRRNLSFLGGQFGFRNLTQTDSTQVVKYSISAFPSSGFLWDISDKYNPKRIKGSLVGSTFDFWCTKVYREFVACNGSSYLTPTPIGAVSNQNLHGLPQIDYLIVSHPNFTVQAERLANLHRAQGLEVAVVDVFQVFNEFSSGAPDPTAIRKLAKMFHDRSLQNGSKMIQYLCLFGDGTYDPKDRVANNNNFILTYQVDNSENHISALVTDDYFGMLDDNEALNDGDLLDIGVGRILVSTAAQAKEQVDKIEHYMLNGSSLFSGNNANCCLDDNSNSTFGDWRTKIVQIADDEENGYFIKNDTEPQYKILKDNHRELNVNKLYCDSYPQQVSAGGQRYPDVFNAINDRITRGALVTNYVGHGGEVGLAEERIVTIPQIQAWQNINALTLFVSATCEFTKYDDPSRVSAGEWVSLNPKGGAIALMTTTRSVFFGVNTSVGLAFFNQAFERDLNGLPKRFGDIAKLTKNSAISSDNKRSFTLIGDPALRLALPHWNVVTDSINGMNIAFMDTLKALSKVTVKGHITDNSGAVATQFNGIIVPTMFDKVKQEQTLGQDPGSPVISYEEQRNILYRGKATVTQGAFEFSFIIPKDIALAFGRGKLSYYAYSSNIDAMGVDTSFLIGGINPNASYDSIGPEISAYLNDDQFVDGGLTDATPVLFCTFFDESGINTVGNGIGHDLTVILDENSSEPIVLNDYYVAELDTYQKGRLKYLFSELNPGVHNLTIKAWDVNNNSSETTLTFTVRQKEEPKIQRLFNYPNPFSKSTQFMLEHNQSCSSLDVQIQIYTISGRLVKTLQEKAITTGFTIRGIFWDGKDDFGDTLANGVYVYRVLYQNDEGKKAEETQKLVILN
ncbi:MAG: type IX secretion system sortase PorU [Bacteroidota bacterium]